MSPILWGAAITLALAMILSLYRVIRGPTAVDRLTGLGLIGTKTIALMVLLGVLTQRVDMFIDITLSYALVSFIGVLVLAKYFEQKENERL
jgi:multicomponent Na+:H+ antiporter subunit F